MTRLSDMSYQTATSLLLVTALYLTLSSASSCSNVQEKLNGLKEAVEALCEGTSVSIPTVRNTWTSVPITSIGSNFLRHVNTFSFALPSGATIPSDAKNVLIYAVMRSGYSNRGITYHLKIFTKDSNHKYFEQYLYMFTYNQVAINTNSDNMWFPMPIDRRIYMTVARDGGASCYAELFVIGYN